jgi:hypothetical protein
MYAFERFLRLCAGRTGQLLNMSSLAIEVGVDVKTIGSWIGMLNNYAGKAKKLLLKFAASSGHDIGLFFITFPCK